MALDSIALTLKLKLERQSVPASVLHLFGAPTNVLFDLICTSTDRERTVSGKLPARYLHSPISQSMHKAHSAFMHTPMTSQSTVCDAAHMQPLISQISFELFDWGCYLHKRITKQFSCDHKNPPLKASTMAHSVKWMLSCAGGTRSVFRSLSLPFSVCVSLSTYVYLYVDPLHIGSKRAMPSAAVFAVVLYYEHTLRGTTSRAAWGAMRLQLPRT